MTDSPVPSQTPVNKLYSLGSITLATFIGGPIPAGILIRQNYIALGKKKQGNYALYICIIVTVILLVSIFSIPTKISDKIPDQLFPLIYTALIYAIIKKYQGKELKAHKENNGKFYSAWKAAGISSIFLVTMLSIAGVYVYEKSGILFPNKKFDSKKYDDGISRINKNEENALDLYSLFDTENPERLIKFIDNIGIPAWEDNIKILNGLDSIPGLYKILLKQNQILKNYCRLRIDSYNLMRKALTEQTKKYDSEIESINKRIESEVGKLK
jgi:hypothetical protein